MAVACTIRGIVDLRRPNQGLGDLQSAGFDRVILDMSLYHTPYELEQYGRDTANEFEQSLDVNVFIRQLQEKKMKIDVVKAPSLIADTKRNDLNEYLLELGKESIRICEQAEAKYVVISPLFAGIDVDRLWEENKAYYLELAAVCKKSDTRILLVNQCKSIGGHLLRGVCSDADIAVTWIDALNKEVGSERFGFCMDVGICTICGQNMQDMIRTLDKHLRMVLLRDCDGYHNSGMLPFSGAFGGQSLTDWLGVIRGLRKIDYQGGFGLEMGDTANAVSPLLRPSLLLFAKKVADYLEWQICIETSLKKYPSIVLFGAGNMCRNFMKCYGEKYPPLFTCDNNQSLWGTVFCGLEVKAPDALLDIPDNCGVVICNVYYREIEQQLQEMGITRVTFFNDEYLPSYHFDRLDRGV